MSWKPCFKSSSSSTDLPHDLHTKGICWRTWNLRLPSPENDIEEVKEYAEEGCWNPNFKLWHTYNSVGLSLCILKSLLHIWHLAFGMIYMRTMHPRKHVWECLPQVMTYNSALMYMRMVLPRPSYDIQQWWPLTRPHTMGRALWLARRHKRYDACAMCALCIAHCTLHIAHCTLCNVLRPNLFKIWSTEILV